MHTCSFRSILSALFIVLLVGASYVSPKAYEIHVVGDGAYKCVDGFWIETLDARIGSSMTAIWAFSENDIFIGDMDGVVHHYDGNSWDSIYEAGGSHNIRCIWGTSNSNLYICTENSFLHFNGSTCTQIMGYTENADYVCVYGFADNDMYMAAEYVEYPYIKGRLYHNSSGDPSSWDLVDLPSEIADQDIRFTSVWGSSGDDVFVTGIHGEIIHWDGMNWHEIDSGSDYYIRDIWGSSGTDVFAVTSNSIIHYDGDTCVAMSHPSVTSLTWIIGDSSANVLVGGSGDDVLHYDGIEWVELPGDEVDFSADAFMFSSDNALIVAWDGVMYRYDGSGISQCENEYFPVRPLDAVSGTGIGNVYAVADEGYVYHYEGSGWNEMARPTTNPLSDIVAFADDDICVSNWQATYHYDGVSWEPLGGEESAGGAIWGYSSDDLYAVQSSYVFHYDGTEWTTIYYNPPTSDAHAYFRDIWGTSPDDIYVVGYVHHSYMEGVHWVEYDCPVILHYDGIDWAPQSHGYLCPTTSLPADESKLLAIWGSSANDIWAGGDLDQPYVLHNNGSGWDLVSAPFTDCEAIWGDGVYTYFLDGDDGDVYLYTNLEWSSWDVTYAHMRDMWVTGVSGSNVLVTVQTEPEGRTIYISGNYYYDTVSFGAEPGSTFEIGAVSPQSTVGGAEYYFVEWSDGGAINHYIVVPDTNVTYTAYFYGEVDVTITTEPEGLEFSVMGTTYSSPYTTTMVCGDEFDIGTVSPQWYKGADNYFVEWSDGGAIVHTATVPHFVDEVFTATFSDTPTGDKVEPIPLVNALHQNHPNPFNPSTTISFSLRSHGHVSLAVYDVTGRLVRVLVDGFKEAGPHEVTWDGRGREGSAVASGLYFYRFETGVYTETRKMVLLR